MIFLANLKQNKVLFKQSKHFIKIIFIILSYSNYGLTSKTISINQTINTINNTKNNSINKNNKILNFYLFNSEGLCIFEKIYEKISLFPNEQQTYLNLKLILKNISHKLLKSNENTEDFIFYKLFFGKYKLVILLKSKIALIGLFSNSSTNYFQILLLIYLYIALLNFKGDSIQKIDHLNKYFNYQNNLNDFVDLKLFSENNQERLKNNELKNINNSDFLELFIYEKYFLKYLTQHFIKLYQYLFRKENFNLTCTKFKNLYILDINTEKIIFDLKKAQQSKKNIKYMKNKKLFEEVLYHSRQMYHSYIKEFSMRYTTTDEAFRFVKIECRSTYPRLLFIIRFIPIIKGIIIIHLYYQKKLSRPSNDNSNLLQNQENKYKEIDLLFGSFIKENHNIDFKYSAPKKLQYIEKFLEEYYITSRQSDLFRINDSKKEFKYFNYNIINIINNMPMDVNDNFEKIFEYINNQLHKQFITEQSKKQKLIDVNKLEKNYNNNDYNGINVKYSKKNDNDLNDNSIDTILVIDNSLVYNDLFINNEKNNNNEKHIENRLTSKERQSTLSLETDGELISNENKNNKIDDISDISEIKIKEKFSITKKDNEVKESEFVNFAKDVKFDDLLDITNIKPSPNEKLKNIDEKILEESENNVLKNNNNNNNEKERDKLSTKRGKGVIKSKLAIYDEENKESGSSRSPLK